MADPVDEAESLRSENNRLRSLVGPDESDYRQMQADRDRAVAAARQSEHELGAARGTIAEMQVQLVRARQDQERYQIALSARRSILDGLARMKRRLISSFSTQP